MISTPYPTITLHWRSSAACRGNHVRHTGNTVEQLELWGGANYTNRAGYVEAQAVADGGIVTANGSGYLEFAREMLLALEVDDKEHIEAWYGFNRNGLYNQQNR